MAPSAQEQELGRRRAAEELRASAAEHRARAHELRASVGDGDPFAESGSDAYVHAGIEERLAEVADLRAAALDERLRGEVNRADALDREADTLGKVSAAEVELHGALSEAAMERARVREQLRLAGASRRAAIAFGPGVAGDVHRARAERHEAWAELHARLALAHQLRSQGLAGPAGASIAEAERLRGAALRAEQQLADAERQAAPSAGSGSPS